MRPPLAFLYATLWFPISLPAMIGASWSPGTGYFDAPVMVPIEEVLGSVQDVVRVVEGSPGG
jgi:hypothetical protein